MKFTLDIILVYVAAIYYNVTHVQHWQRAGTIPLNQTVSISVSCVTLTKLTNAHWLEQQLLYNYRAERSC